MQFIIPTAILIFLYMMIIFIIARMKNDNSIVDIFWGPGFILVSVFSLLQGEEIGIHKIILNLMVLVWGSRLAFYIYRRNRGRGEDFRYAAWRETWRFFTLRSFFQIFMLQGLIMLIVAMPVYYVNLSPPAKMGVPDVLGLIIFMTGFFFEIVGDRQMAMFKKDPANAGKLMTAGLWSYTRHPNYFGEALVWFGITLLALGVPPGYQTVLSPVVLVLLLRFVSGVPMLEKKYEGREDWNDYKKKTAAFVPFIKFL